MMKLSLPWQPRIPAVDASLFEIRESRIQRSGKKRFSKSSSPSEQEKSFFECDTSKYARDTAIRSTGSTAVLRNSPFTVHDSTDAQEDQS